MRRLTGLLIACEQEDDEVDRLTADLERAEAVLASRVPADPAPRVGPAAEGHGRVYLDHAFDIGSFNPCVPEYDIDVQGDEARGSVTFPLAYEGPPGLVHGGFLALFFDCVVQHHNCEVGLAGKTTSLEVAYRRPTPLLAPLSFEVRRTVTGDRIHSTGSLASSDRVCCEARVDAIAGVRANLPEVSPRRVVGA
jgi:hypothetical protein